MDNGWRNYFIYLDKTKHFHQILIMNLNGSFSPRSFDDVCGQIVKQKFDCYIHTYTGLFLNPLTTIHRTHSSHTKGLAIRIYLITNVVFLFIYTLYANNRHIFSFI